MPRRLFFLFAAVAGVAASAAAAPVPHAFMGDVYQCERCHEKVPMLGQDDYTTVEFKKDIVTLCEECHQEMVQHDKHPVDIRPDRSVPAELHLDSYLSITCVTCHNPHGQAWADKPYVPYTWYDNLLRLMRGERRHRTFFLRRSNADGELCATCHGKDRIPVEEIRDAGPPETSYVGSAKCRECHPDVYEAWSRTVHARFVGQPKMNPLDLKATFQENRPFEEKKILYTLGVHWTQRYVIETEKEPMVRPEIWSIQSNEWLSSGTYNRSWYRYCAGCHLTGFNPFKGTWAELGIGCEACHGPGRDHSESTDQFDIINPANLTENRRDMICESCHTSGHDRSGLYRFPVGYRPGEDLNKYFKGLVPKPGQEADTYTGDGSYADRHRQFEYWVSRYNITQGILCDVCKNFRQIPSVDSGEVFLSSSEFCATCHNWYWLNYKDHSRHTPASAQCIQCHTPALSKHKSSYSIHDHKFQFGAPVYLEDLTLEQRCQTCHGVNPKYTPARLLAIK